MNDGQLSLPFDEPFSVSDQPSLWTPRDIWVRFTQRMVSYFVEDAVTPEAHPTETRVGV
jgi:ATP-dependent DNA helicase RecG